MKKSIFILAALAAVVMSASAQSNEVTGTCGQTVTITATADAGYVFQQWQDGNTDNPRTIEITSTLSVLEYQATFTAANVNIVYSSNDPDLGTVSGPTSGLYGSNQTLTATAKDACSRFVRWSDGNTDNPRTITLGATESANTYQAIFELVEFTVKATGAANGSVTITIQ